MKTSELKEEYLDKKDFFHMTKKGNIDSIIAKGGLEPNNGIRDGELVSPEDKTSRVFFCQGMEAVLAQANNTVRVIKNKIEEIKRTNFRNNGKDIKKEMQEFMDRSGRGGYIDRVNFITKELFENGIDENLTKEGLDKIMYDIVKTMWENDICLKVNLEEGIDYSWDDFNFDATGTERKSMTPKNMHVFEGHMVTLDKIELITDKNKNPRTAWDVYKEMAIYYKKEHPDKEYLPVDEWLSETGEMHHETDYLSMFIEMERHELEKTDIKDKEDEPRINEYGEIIRPNNTEKFSSSEIGKATINTPTQAKQEADRVEEENSKDKNKEEVSLDDN